MREKLHEKKYKSREEFLQDVNQIVDNSNIYNGMDYKFLTRLNHFQKKNCPACFTELIIFKSILQLYFNFIIILNIETIQKAIYMTVYISEKFNENLEIGRKKLQYLKFSVKDQIYQERYKFEITWAQFYSRVNICFIRLILIRLLFTIVDYKIDIVL